LTGNNAGLRSVVSSRLSHRELRSSLGESHTHSVQFFVQFFYTVFAQFILQYMGPLTGKQIKKGQQTRRTFRFTNIIRSTKLDQIKHLGLVWQKQKHRVKYGHGQKAFSSKHHYRLITNLLLVKG
jgi:hypothetical protein